MRNLKTFEKRIICFDFDGTCTEKDTYPFLGKANMDISRLTLKLRTNGYYIIINSSRDTLDYDTIQAYLDGNFFVYDAIHLKCKPTADVYIDDKSMFGSARDIEMFIESVFSENVDVYCQQIASDTLKSEFMKNISNVPENPTYVDHHDDNYRVILPLTGGMDSVTLWNMVKEAGTKYEPYYVDMGQDYAAQEIAIVTELLGHSPNILRVPVDFKQYKHILTARNAIIIMQLAEEMKKQGWWGEIWFGNLQGESPTVNGDKSSRFFNDINKQLVYHNYDVRVVSPLIGMNKFDQVTYWKDRNKLQTLIDTKSCFHPVHKQCGECQSCLRKYTAFKYHGIDIKDTFETFKLQPFIDKYKVVMQEALDNKDFTHYSLDRIVKTLSVINKL